MNSVAKAVKTALMIGFSLLIVGTLGTLGKGSLGYVRGIAVIGFGVFTVLAGLTAYLVDRVRTRKANRL